MRLCAKKHIPGCGRHLRIAIFAISLADAEERRRAVADYLSRLGLPWRFFDAHRYGLNGAHDGPATDADTGMTAGEIGCFMSHRAVWDEVSKSNLDYAVILEDDAVLVPTVDYHALFASLQRLGVECVRLALDTIEHAKPLVSLGASLGMISRLTAPRFGLGLAAYAVTPRAAGQLYSAASRLREPVDLWIERYHNHRLPIFNLMPPCGVIIRSYPTTIEGRNRIQPRSLLRYALTRSAQELADLRDNSELARLDNALRRRADALEPGSAHWPHSQLRKQFRLFQHRSPNF